MNSIVRTRTFRSGNSQAVRLPKDVAFEDGTELVAVRSGDVLTLYPVRMTIGEMLERLAALPVPGTPETRDTGDLGERPGL